METCIAQACERGTYRDIPGQDKATKPQLPLHLSYDLGITIRGLHDRAFEDAGEVLLVYEADSSDILEHEDTLFSAANLKRLLRNPLTISIGEITRWQELIKGNPKNRKDDSHCPQARKTRGRPHRRSQI